MLSVAQTGRFVKKFISVSEKVSAMEIGGSILLPVITPFVRICLPKAKCIGKACAMGIASTKHFLGG
jgi:hypothetical protein